MLENEPKLQHDPQQLSLFGDDTSEEKQRDNVIHYKPVKAETKESTTFSAPSDPKVFPLEYFPDIYQDALKEIAESVGTPVEIPAAALITLIGAAVGRTRCLKIKNGWIEYPNIFMGIIGKSGSGKTPAVNAIYKHIHSIEEQWYKQYKQEKANTEEGQEPPCPRQLIIDDSTIEALTYAFEANPRGILWNRDELAGLFLDLDKYNGGKGGTLTRILSAYDSGSWKVNRVDEDKNKNISSATLSIFGTLQPQALIDIFKKKDIDIGIIPRFLFVSLCQDKPVLWSDTDISVTTETNIHGLIKNALDLEFDDHVKPVALSLTEDAKKTFIEWYDKTAKESWTDDEEYNDSFCRKLHAQCLRLALICYCMHSIVDNNNVAEHIPGYIIEKSIALAEYFKLQQLHVLDIILSAKKEELSSFHKHVAQALLFLENEINGGMIATARVTEIVNRDLGERYKVGSREVGKALTSFGFKPQRMPDGNSRGVRVFPADLDKMRKLLGLTSETAKTAAA